MPRFKVYRWERTVTFVALACLLQACIADAPVGPEPSSADPPQFTGQNLYPELVCTPPAAWGDYGSCLIHPPHYWSVFSVSNWSFTGEGAVGGLVERTHGTTEMSWGGQMVTSGWVDVLVVNNGTEYPLNDFFDIPARASGLPTWPSRVSAVAASDTAIDHCLSSVGITTNLDCTYATRGYLFNPGFLQPGSGISVDSVGDYGPNVGYHYVSGLSAHAHMRIQVNRTFRPDGIAYSTSVGDTAVTNHCSGSMTLYAVNTGCAFVLDFTSFWNYAWNHEGLHLTAAEAAALDPANDVSKELLVLIRTSAGAVYNQAANIYFNIHQAVKVAAICTHLGGMGPTYWFWRHSSVSGWYSEGVIMDESKDPGCPT